MAALTVEHMDKRGAASDASINRPSSVKEKCAGLAATASPSKQARSCECKVSYPDARSPGEASREWISGKGSMVGFLCLSPVHGVSGKT